MSRKRVAHGYRENPSSGTVPWPLGNSGKIYMRISQHSTEKSVSVFTNQSATPRHMKAKPTKATSSSSLNVASQISILISSLKKAFNERYDPIIEANNV